MTTTGTDPAPKIEGEAQQAASTTPSSVADVAAQAGALYAEAIHQLQESSTTLFKHDDAMLTWAIGLMGAGLFYANTLLADAPRGLRFVALARWIVGILASLAGRVVGSRVLQKTAGWYIKEILAFKGAVISPKKDDLLATVKAVIEGVLRLITEVRAQQAGLYWWWVRLSLAAHILAGTGVLTVVAVSFLPDHLAAVVLVGLDVVALIIFVRASGAIKKEFERSMEEAKSKARQWAKPPTETGGKVA